MGTSEVALAIGLGVVALASTHGTSATAAGLAFEALFYGGFMWSFAGNRVRREVENAPDIIDPEIRDGRTGSSRVALAIVGVVAASTVVTILSPGSPIVAGIALGAGAYGIGLYRWLVRWEAEHSVEVLRVPAWRRRKGVNNYRVMHRATR